MSLQQAKEFLRKVGQDKALQARVAALNWDAKALLPIAAEMGYALQAVDLQAGIDEEMGVLSEDDLDLIAGGRCEVRRGSSQEGDTSSSLDGDF